ELIGIYRDTDPRLGRASEKGKYQTAEHALWLAGRLTHKLTDWAENHIAGAIYRHSKTKDRGEFNWNSHAHEQENYRHNGGITLTAEQSRQYIAILLEQSAHSKIGWRWNLAESLIALNEGEVQFFTKPSKTRKHGQPYTLNRLRRLAVLHVHVLVGT